MAPGIDVCCVYVGGILAPQPKGFTTLTCLRCMVAYAGLCNAGSGLAVALVFYSRGGRWHTLSARATEALQLLLKTATCHRGGLVCKVGFVQRQCTELAVASLSSTDGGGVFHVVSVGYL